MKYFHSSLTARRRQLQNTPESKMVLTSRLPYTLTLSGSKHGKAYKILLSSIADRNFRQRDPRCARAERYKDLQRGKDKQSSGKMFTNADFTYPADFSYSVCPAGKRLYRSGYNVKVKNYQAIKFKGQKSACVPCKLRSRCLHLVVTTTQ